MLDMLIGTIPGVFSTGEVKHLTRYLLHADEQDVTSRRICSCMRSFRRCPAWSKAIGELSRQVGYDVYADPLRFEIRLLNNDRRCRSKGRLTGKLQPRGPFGYAIQHAWTLPLARLVTAMHGRAIANNWLLFDTIGSQLGVQWVVDSSKDLRRLWMLHASRGDDVRAIVLMRDILGVASSGAKRGKNPLTTARAWVRRYNRTYRVLHNAPSLKFLPVRYERLTDDPAGVRREIAAWLGLPDPGDQVVLNTHDHHVVGGNTMRYRGRIEIRYDETWKDKLPCQTAEQIHSLLGDLHPAWMEMGMVRQ